MPKKFKGENSKSAEARVRKEAKKQAEAEEKQKRLDDELWRDDDKHILKKQQRKDDKEKKRVEVVERKQQKQQLLEAEMASITSGKQDTPARVTRATIQAYHERLENEAMKKRNQPPAYDELPLEENVNREEVENEARTIEDAIVVLSVNEPTVDLHPEKRMKAAYAAYEERNLPLLKQENPNMRLSQLKQMLHKDWVKSPDNPLLQQQMTLANSVQ